MIQFLWSIKGVLLLVVFAVLSICLLYVFFGAIINMVGDKSLYCYSKGIFKNSKNSRLIGRMILVVLSFLIFLVETVAIIFGYILIIGVVICIVLFDKEYGLNDCKKILLQFKIGKER